jgi:hypothetical protein
LTQWRKAALHRSTPLDAHVQNDPGHAIDSASIQRGALLCLNVIDAAGEFNDAVVYLDTDRAGLQGFILLEFSENLLLNLRVIFHVRISMLLMLRMRPTGRVV